MASGPLDFVIFIGPVRCRPFRASLAGSYSPLPMSMAKWSESYAQSHFVFRDTIRAQSGDGFSDAHFPGFHAALLHRAPQSGVTRALLAASSLSGKPVLLTVTAERDGSLHCECKSSDQDAIREIMVNGGISNILHLD